MSLLKMGEHCLQLCVHVKCRNTEYTALSYELIWCLSGIILIAGDMNEIGFKIWLV